jgi:hypothetical protein
MPDHMCPAQQVLGGVLCGVDLVLQRKACVFVSGVLHGLSSFCLDCVTISKISGSKTERMSVWIVSVVPLL